MNACPLLPRKNKSAPCRINGELKECSNCIYQTAQPIQVLHLRACDNCGEPIDNNGEIFCATCKPQRHTVYQDNGYRDRDHYLASLSEDLDIPLDVVHAASEILGPSEDFDGLVSNLEDFGGICSEFTQEFDDFTDADPGL